MPFFRARLLASLTFVLLLTFAVGRVEAQVGVNVFGISAHFEDEDWRNPDGFNPGLGLHWTFDRSRRTALDVNVGLYRDSFHHLNQHLSLGGRVRLWGPFELGLQTVWTRSQSVNYNYPVVEPLPYFSVRLARVVFNTIYIPEVGSFNSVPTLAVTATVFPFSGGFDWDDTRQIHSDRWSELEFAYDGLLRLGNFRGMGFAWRRMLDAEHGLRLGFNMNGWTTVGGEAEQGAYRVAVLAQYFRRRALTEHSNWFLAAGLELVFEAYRSTNMTTALPVNLGWEYRFGSGVGAFVQTGLRFSRYTEVIDRSEGYHVRKYTAFGSDGIKVGLAARI